MPYKIKKLEELGIIQIVYLGEVSLDQRMAIVTDLALDHIHCDNPKLLIDARSLLSSMSETEQKIWGKFVASREELKNSTVAVIYNSNIEINQTAMKHAQQSGHIVEQFHTEQDAIKWLLSR